METSVKGIAALANEALEKVEAEGAAETAEEPTRKRPRRACTAPGYKAAASSDPRDSEPAPPSRKLVGRLLVVHANGKTYGRGGDAATAEDGERVKAAKRSNREDFTFSARDYCAMRDSGRPYSGDPRVNALLPLPRPTYTEFINRARRARCLDRVDFLYCPADAPRLPAVDYAAYERVVYAGVSFRRFALIWRPERHVFFKPQFQARVVAVLAAAVRARKTGGALGSVPDCVLHDILAFASSKQDARRDDYDDLETVNSGARHLFLPAPGSSGIRERLFDAVMGL